MKLARTTLVALLVVVALAEPVIARGWSPLGFGQLLLDERQSPIEQQSDYPWLPGPLDCSQNQNCIVNPTPCAWDVDDHGQYIVVDRVLKPGEAGGVSWCIIADANPQWQSMQVNGPDGPYWYTAWWSSNRIRAGLTVRSSSPDLVVTLTYTDLSKTITAQPYRNADRQWQYDICSQVVYDPGDPALTLIPGSQVTGANGYGIRSGLVISVTNASTKRATVTLDAQNVGTGAKGAGCLTTGQRLEDLPNVEYPFHWRTS